MVCCWLIYARVHNSWPMTREASSDHHPYPRSRLWPSQGQCHNLSVSDVAKMHCANYKLGITEYWIRNRGNHRNFETLKLRINPKPKIAQPKPDLTLFQRALCQQQRAGGWHLRPQVLFVPPGAVCQGRHHGHRPHIIIIAFCKGSSFQRRPNSTAGLVPSVLAFPI